jgi:4-hydroxybenzoate polyprenyltransferase
LIAGGTLETVLRLGISMLAIQAGIGTVNDIVDADRDRGSKPGKPLPRGVISEARARVLAVIAIVGGLALSVPSGPAATLVAVAGLAIGLTYDLWLKGTAWSWLPFALGIPLLPVYAWIGATSTLPGSFALLVPTAVAAGAALAIVNAVADVDRDRAAGVGSVAGALGTRAAWRIHAALLAAVFGVALASLALAPANAPLAPGLAVVIVGIGGLIVAIGAHLARSLFAERRERGWELEAVGIGLAAIAWIGGLIGSGR